MRGAERGRDFSAPDSREISASRSRPRLDTSPPPSLRNINIVTRERKPHGRVAIFLSLKLTAKLSISMFFFCFEIHRGIQQWANVSKEKLLACLTDVLAHTGVVAGFSRLTLANSQLGETTVVGTSFLFSC